MVQTPSVNACAKEIQHHADLLVHGLQAGLIDPIFNTYPKLKPARSNNNVGGVGHA